MQSTSKSVLNDETDSLSTTSSKCVDGVTKSALLKQLAITDGENKFQEFLVINMRGTKKILVTAEYQKKNRRKIHLLSVRQIFGISWWIFLSGGIPPWDFEKQYVVRSTKAHLLVAGEFVHIFEAAKLSWR